MYTEINVKQKNLDYLLLFTQKIKINNQPVFKDTKQRF